ncbi:hypothetical protein AQJ91_17685 [Streptomyces dysideae]|uniref:Uncharacterized protein n=1 Tax=Streptomyces dysideae TaxID=909626 RepID=A0A101UZF2_9ACTN|nr:hypothetical protein AQJ91_17685 [Streptomyces dysideae]
MILEEPILAVQQQIIENLGEFPSVHLDCEITDDLNLDRERPLTPPVTVIFGYVTKEFADQNLFPPLAHIA